MFKTIKDGSTSNTTSSMETIKKINQTINRVIKIKFVKVKAGLKN